MKFLNKPSHYLALLLTLTGGLLIFHGEKVLPKEGPKKQRWLTQQERMNKLRSLAKTHKAGQNDMLDVRTGTASSSHVQGTGGEGGSDPVMAQLVTLEGSVAPELYYPDSEEKVAPRVEAWPVNLELTWMGEGATTGQGILSSTTDRLGRFDFKDLQPGAYRLRAIPEDKDDIHLPIAVDLQIPEREEQSPGEQPRFPVSELILPLPRNMQGSLAWAKPAPGTAKTAKHSPMAMEGVRVSVSEVGLNRGSAVVDAKGKFKIEGVGDGPYTIQLRNPEGNNIQILEAKPSPQSKGEVAMMILARQP